MPVDALDCTISPLTDVASLQNRWRALEDKSDTPIFLSWDWMGPWLSLVRSSLYLCEVKRGGEDVGLAVLGFGQKRYGPFGFRTVYLNQSGNSDEDQVFIEYNGLLCAPSDRDDVWASFLDALTHSRARLPRTLKSWSLLRLAGLCGASVDGDAEHRFATVDQDVQNAYLIDLEEARTSPEGYLGSLSANTRRQILRSRRLLAEEGSLTFHVARAPEQVGEWLGQMTALQSSWFTSKGRAAALTQPFFSAFVKRLIVDNLESGSVEFIQCKAIDQTIGYLVNLKTGDRVYSYQSAFAQYNDNKIKPGLVCHAMLTEHYLQEGLRSYNLLAGDGQYKKSLSNVMEPLLWTSFARPTARVKAVIGLRRWLGR